MKTKAGFLPNGEINRRDIDETARRVMAPLVDEIGAVIPPPAPAMEWLRHTVTALYNIGVATEFVDALKLLCALVGLAAPPDVESLVCHPVAANHFMLSCLSVVEEMTEGAGTFAMG